MKSYFLYFVCYLGFSPQLQLLKARRLSDQNLEYHIVNGAILFFLILPSLIFFITIQIIAYIVGVNSENLNILLIELLYLLSLIPFIVWGGLFLINIPRLTSFSNKPLPIVSKLSKNKNIRLYSIVWGWAFQLAIVFALLISFRASYLTQPHSSPASVYLLYENTIYIPIPNVGVWTASAPKWVFNLGFYPISEVATFRWGKESVAIKPLTRENLKEAFQNGRLVFIASHGGSTNGTISLPDDTVGNYSPHDIQKDGGTGSNLQFVYLAGCDAGSMETDWRNSLNPAKVKLFNRISWEVEHAYWLWFEGPIITASLK
jgi:hypothetical protein